MDIRHPNAPGAPFPADPVRAYEQARLAMQTAETKSAFCEAEAAFRSLGGFRDAAALAEQCRLCADVCRKDEIYAAALWQMERKSSSGYMSAAQLFDSIPGWKDADALGAASREDIERIRLEGERARLAAVKLGRVLRRAAVAVAALIPVCIAAALLWRHAIAPLAQYKRAVALMEGEKYAQAWSLLENLEVRDSAARRDEIRAALNSNAEPGSFALLGSFEQDGNEENGPEAILWRVLERDGDRVLLLSEYALDSLPFEKPGRRVTWEDCQLRSWLNGEFLSEAFSDEEMGRILPSSVTADRNPSYRPDPGADTEDRLFLLSVKEVYGFFPTDGERQCFPTAWAKERLAYCNRENGCTWWWLRTPGQVLNYAVPVLDSGAVREEGYHVSYEYIAVRPAMWARLDG